MVGASAHPPASRQSLDAALRKAAAVWVQPDGHASRLVWALWSPRPPHAGHLLVACGGSDQTVPGLVHGAGVTVVVARSGTRTALTVVSGTAKLILPDAPTVAALAAARRNAEPGWAHVFTLPLLGT